MGGREVDGGDAGRYIYATALRLISINIHIDDHYCTLQQLLAVRTSFWLYRAVVAFPISIAIPITISIAIVVAT